MNEFFKLLILTPFYPHWLEQKRSTEAKTKLFLKFRGKVLETGCGYDNAKEITLQINKKVSQYIATDSYNWNFKVHNDKVDKFGFIYELLIGRKRDDKTIDKYCDATNLPFKESSFDTYFCFSVLEHIDNPKKLFLEANKVLKKNGNMYIGIPFMYREHGIIKDDYQRITRGGFYYLAKETGFKVTNIYSNVFFGSMLTIFINQYIIRKIFEGKVYTKIILLPISPIIFLISNIFGYIIDLMDQDIRFSPMYYASLKKINKAN